MLQASGLLDSEREEVFDRLTWLGKTHFQTKACLVSLVDKDRQWFKSKCGLEADETGRAVSFCGFAVTSGEPLIVLDAAVEPRFAHNPLVLGPPNIRFYAGAPIIVNGFAFGSFCVVDDKPRDGFSDEDLKFLTHLAETTAYEIDMRMKALRDLETIDKQTAKAAAAFEEAERAKESFLAMINHEIRTPLNAIIGFADIIEQELYGKIAPDQYKEYVAHICGGGARLQALMTRVIEYAAAEAGTIKLQEETFGVKSLLESAVQMMEGEARLKGVRLYLEDFESTSELTADPMQTEQACLQLLENGIKFSPENGVVRIGFKCEDGAPTIIVVDEGPGLAAEFFEEACSAFTQMESAASRHYDGAGLGLPLARKLMELHGGALVRLEADKGARIALQFPTWRNASQEAPDAAACA
ncbi:MAG: GAF domain-containing sensor histidine kinase [Pseudomonadota bacterium]